MPCSKGQLAGMPTSFSCASTWLKPKRWLLFPRCSCAPRVYPPEPPPPAAPEVPSPFDSPSATRALAAYREQVEAGLPSLLTEADVRRLERLRMRFVKLVPKEYRNGVSDGIILIPLEHREATQFAEQAQMLTHELAPVWRRTEAAAYQRAYPALAENLAELRRQIGAVDTVDAIERRALAIGNLLGTKFGLDARLQGDKGQVIEETALEVRSNLNNSLAAALSDQWPEAERLRLEAYTAFDTEIEARLLPRNPDLALQAERSFLDGSGESGIKALLDRRAPVEELSAGYDRALHKLAEGVALLQVAVSPAMIGYTALGRGRLWRSTCRTRQSTRLRLRACACSSSPRPSFTFRQRHSAATQAARPKTKTGWISASPTAHSCLLKPAFC
jgi:hypothetical protein